MLAGEGYGFPADARNAKKKCQLSEWELLTSRQLVHRVSLVCYETKTITFLPVQSCAYSVHTLVIREDIRLQVQGCRRRGRGSRHPNDAHDACSWVGPFIAHSCELAKN